MTSISDLPTNGVYHVSSFSEWLSRRQLNRHIQSNYHDIISMFHDSGRVVMHSSLTHDPPAGGAGAPIPAELVDEFRALCKVISRQ